MANLPSTQGANGESAILEILAITRELTEKNNLGDFFEFSRFKLNEIRDLQSEILRSFHQYMANGERLFNELVEAIFRRTMIGWHIAGISEKIETKLPKHALSSFAIWNRFMLYAISDLAEEGVLDNVSGSLSTAQERIVEFSSYVDDLVALLRKRRIGAIYFWGFPEIDIEAERSTKIPDFELWLKDLKEGMCDHRVWLFTDQTVQRLRRAYLAVKNGRSPLAIRIDKESWTLADIYRFHPRGSDEKFWVEILDTLRERIQKRRDAFQGGPIPREIYNQFKRKESDAVTSILDEEESDILNRSKKKKTGKHC
ncbi:MAG: hypothetical protein M1587_11330 [Thaumarchaeota archaeon]|nr:hypothetical protein [Nitrososphaerota archaeon]